MKTAKIISLKYSFKYYGIDSSLNQNVDELLNKMETINDFLVGSYHLSRFHIFISARRMLFPMCCKFFLS